MREPYPPTSSTSLCLRSLSAAWLRAERSQSALGPPPTARSSPCEIAGAGEHGVEHRLGEPAGEGVLLARVVAAEHGERTDADLEAVGEPRPRPRERVPARGEDAPRVLVREAAEHDDHREAR